MQNLHLLRMRFPKTYKTILRGLLTGVLILLAVGGGLALFLR